MGFKSINKAGEIREIARQVTIALGFFNVLLICSTLKKFLYTTNCGPAVRAARERKERKRTCIAPIVSILTTKHSDLDHTPHLPFLLISIR